jgi:HupE / UreJ protein
MRPRTVAAVLAAALAATAAPAAAHTGGSTGHAGVAVEGAAVHYRLTLWPATLPADMGEELRRVRDGDAGARERVLAIIRSKVTFVADGARCAAGRGALAPGAPGVDSVTLTVEFTCGAAVRELVVRDDVFDAFGPDHHTIGRIDAGGSTTSFAFAPDRRELRLRLDAGRYRLGDFVALGVEHIMTGWDHLLFLLALLLPGGGVLAMVKIVTAFTIAHSVTLSLATLEIVTVPDRLVESVIALSIAAVAAENLVGRPTVTRRWIVSFVFGLVHGFGFSSALRELALPTEGLILSLFGFNAGVEIGQAAVVVVGVPALALPRRAGWERRLIWGGSAAILVVGLILFVERAIL